MTGEKAGDGSRESGEGVHVFSPVSRLPSPWNGRLRVIPIIILSVSLATAQTLTPVVPPLRPDTAGAVSIDSVAAADSAAVDTTRYIARADTAQVVKHHFNHRQQIITGGIMMACLAGMMTILNNYNPQ